MPVNILLKFFACGSVFVQFCSNIFLNSCMFQHANFSPKATIQERIFARVQRYQAREGRISRSLHSMQQWDQSDVDGQSSDSCSPGETEAQGEREGRQDNKVSFALIAFVIRSFQSSIKISAKPKCEPKLPLYPSGLLHDCHRPHRQVV